MQYAIYIANTINVDAIKTCETDEHGRVIGPGDLFWRTPEVELRRSVDYEKDINKWATTADRLRSESFGYATTKDKKGKLVAPKPDNAETQIVWIENKYPYAFDEGIKHDVCFFDSIQGRKVCLDVINNKLKTGKHIVWFTNSMENRSIPEIDHIQIIYRKI